MRFTHGMTRSPTYRVWANMKQRCMNPKHPSHVRYGGRGISVCDRWMESFPAFLEDMGERPDEFATIERVNNNGNYEPGNCVWAPRDVQCRNKRNNHRVRYNGMSLCITDWAALLGISYPLLLYRLQAGWSVSEAFTTAPKQRRKQECFNGEA